MTLQPTVVGLSREEWLIQATRRVTLIRDFRVHAAALLSVMMTLLILANAVDYLRYRANLRVVWPLVVWAVGLFAHGLAVFGFGTGAGSAWRGGGSTS